MVTHVHGLVSWGSIRLLVPRVIDSLSINETENDGKRTFAPQEARADRSSDDPIGAYGYLHVGDMRIVW